MKIFNKLKEDKGVSNTISFIVIMLFIMIMLVSFIDVGLYFNAKNQMLTAAENGARSVALYGGVNTSVRNAKGGMGPEDLVWISIPDSYKTTTSNRTIVVDRSGVDCQPKSGRIKAGDLVYCDVTYIYNGIAGRFSLFNMGRMSQDKSINNNSMTVRGTSVSEVSID